MGKTELENDGNSGHDEAVPTADMGPGSVGPGGQIGPYKLLSILGEGGYGIVYLAEQLRPVKRRVALKVIKPGMDTKQVIARFESERQALALLDHPNVAHVHEAGTTSAGQPYFAMEYVKGVSIIEHCDRHKLSVDERLDLFLQVCEAIQHAHQKGIIHRDIKPSNILVSFENERAVPKVIDFGIAKAISQPLTDRTLYTERGQLVGTLEYTSPEQAEMTSQDIDTRSDIYSLGVVLYELLTGVLPFESQTLREGGPDRLRQVIREQDPKTPSTRLSRLTREDSTRIAQQRRADAGVLRRKLRGDLDWITLKAMAKDRTHRYGSSGELAADIRRHLKDEPVVAGPPSTLYRMRKYVRRHKALVTGLAAVLVVLLAGIIGVVIFAVKADRQARTTQAVTDFLNEDLLGAVALQQAMSQQVTVRSILDAAADRLEGRFADRPLVEASIRQTLGTTYIELGNYEQAEPHLKRAYDVRHRLLGDNDLLTLTSMSLLGRLYQIQARYKEAEPLLAQAVESRRRILGSNHADTLETSAWLGRLYAELATPQSQKEAEKLLTAALKSGSDLFGKESPIVLEAMLGLAFLRGAVQGKPDEAVPLCLEGWGTARKALGEGHRLTYQFMGLAVWLGAWGGRFQEAQRHAQAVMEANLKVLGKEHPDTLSAMCTLGMVHAWRDNLEEAESLLAPGLEGLHSILGEGHAIVLFYSRTLASVYMRQGRYENAEDLLKRIIEEGGRLLGDDHPIPTTAAVYMMSLYAMQERGDDLKTWCSREIERIGGTSGQNKTAVSRILNWLAYLQATYPSAAIRDGHEAIRNAKKNCELTSGNRTSLVVLAVAYAETGDFASAIRELKKAIESGDSPGSTFSLSDNSLQYLLKRLESGHAVRDSVFTMTATTMIAEGRHAAAEQELTTAIRTVRRYLGETHPETRGCILVFIELYEAWGKPEKAEEWRAKLPQAENMRK